MNNKCVTSEAQDFAMVDKLVEVRAGLPDNCTIDENGAIGAIETPDVVTDECLQEAKKVCDAVDGLEQKFWRFENSCDNETLSYVHDYEVCFPNGCSPDDFEKLYGVDTELLCTFSVSTSSSSSTSAFSRVSIIGGVGIILAGAVALI